MKQHAPKFLELVQEAKKHVNELSAASLKQKLDAEEELTLIDVREDSEWINGHIPTAIHLGKGIIERDIEKTIPNCAQHIVVYCSGGFRSALVTHTLQKMGYTQVKSLENGSKGWIDAGYQLVG